MSRILYVSYDGLLEPLGESQVVSYLERLATDHAITVISFEKPEDLRDAPRLSAMEGRLRGQGIAWRRLRYHKRPPVLSTIADVLAGIIHARRLCRAQRISVIHARSYVPALITLGARSASDARFLFDMRGFWVDEKVEGGHWTRGGLLYRAGKWWERRFFQAADAIVSLTEQGVRSLPELGYEANPGVAIDVIPTCVDLQRFTAAGKEADLERSLGLEGFRVIGSTGTVSNWYMREAMLRCLARLAAASDRTRVLFVTREDHHALRRDAEHAGIPGDRLVITRADFADMPRFTRLFDAGLFFIRPALSKRASAATKLAEFLASGVPVIINDGVGDSGVIVRQGRVGVVLPRLDGDSVERALPEIDALLSDPDVALRCRRVATERFDLDGGVATYRRLYARLSEGSARSVPSEH